MKHLFIVLVSIAMLHSNMFAQKKGKTETTSTISTAPLVATSTSDWKKSTIELSKKNYARAMRYGDMMEAKASLFNLIELDSVAGGPNYKDSLISLYFSTQSYVNAILLGREMLKVDAKNVRVLSMLAASEQSMGLPKESLEHYETLFGITQDLNQMYQIATINYQLERMGECKAALERILSESKADKETVYISYSERQGQDVPLKAAAWNIKGFVCSNAKDEVGAKECFNKAIQIFPEFALAKANLDAIVNPKPKAVKQGG